MTAPIGTRIPRITALRVAVLVIVWLACVYVMAPSLGLYYERLAAWYALPSLGLVYAYCMSHAGVALRRSSRSWPQPSRSCSWGLPPCSPRGPRPDALPTASAPSRTREIRLRSRPTGDGVRWAACGSRSKTDGPGCRTKQRAALVVALTVVILLLYVTRRTYLR